MIRRPSLGTPLFVVYTCSAAVASVSAITAIANATPKFQFLDDPALTGIASKHGKTPAQIAWRLQSGLIVIPKSVRAERLKENIDALDVRLDADDMARIAKLDSPDGRMGPNPATATF